MRPPLLVKLIGFFVVATAYAADPGGPARID
jgi:hypothetical protein